MTKFCILVTSPSIDAEGSYSALKFIEAALQGGHQITGVFFYQAGVDIANRFQTVLSDERDIHSLWKTIAQTHDIPLQVCVTAANRRGVISQLDAAEDQSNGHFNLEKPFESVGIGELVTMLNACDRSIQF